MMSAAIIAEMKGWADTALAQLQAGLGGKRFLLSDYFTAADIMLGYTVNMAKNFGVPFAHYPAVAT